MIDEFVDCEKCPIKDYCEKVKTDLIEKKVEEVDLSNIEQSESRYRRELHKYMFDSPVSGGRKPCPLLKAEDVESCLSREIEKAEESVAWTFAEKRVNETEAVPVTETEGLTIPKGIIKSLKLTENGFTIITNEKTSEYMPEIAQTLENREDVMVFDDKPFTDTLRIEIPSKNFS